MLIWNYLSRMDKILKCYGGKKTTAPKEKSFIRNFFEGNEKEESSIFGKSLDNVLEKDSSTDSKESVSTNILQSPALFQSFSRENVVKNLSEEENSIAKRHEKKITSPPKKKKQVRRKRNGKKRPKQPQHYSTKYCKSLQPRWSEIYSHDFTVEKLDYCKKSVPISKYGYQNRKFSKKTSKPSTIALDGNLSDSERAEKFQKTSQKAKGFSSRSSSHQDSSGDMFIPSFKNEKSGKINIHSIQKQKYKYDSTSLSDLEKKFKQSLRLCNFSITNHSLNVNEDLYTKNTSVSTKSFIKSFDVSSERKQKKNTSKMSNLSQCSPCVSHASQGCNLLQNSPKRNFFTSTPICKMASFPSHQKKTTSRALSSRASPVIPYLNSYKHIGDNYSKFFGSELCEVSLSSASKKCSKFSQMDYVSNKSLTCPRTDSVNSNLSSKTRSLVNVSHMIPVENSVEFTKAKLLTMCNQDFVANFADIYDWKNSKVKKIGEGSYGEVFMITKKKSSCVLKIIPVSEESTHSSYQGLQNVLSEVKISKCLSELRNNKINQSNNFIRFNKVSFVSGSYPSILLDAWDNYSETKSSYNERPDAFDHSQNFVILDLEYGGKDMSSFVLRNAVEAESILKQIAVTLAVAEEEFLFEHRDLHLGNILIQRNRRKSLSYKLRGKDISFPCHGLHVTVIDFTLSRLHEDGYIFYYDLGQEVSLFEQSGDYQFDVYKSMRKHLENQWQECLLYSNILWLKFLCLKLKESEYSRPSSVAHKNGLKAIDFFNAQLTNCNSATACLTKCGITQIKFEKSKLDCNLTKKSILVSRNSIRSLN